MTAIYSQLITEDLDNCRYVRLVEPFVFESSVLKKAGLKSQVTVPTGFVYDYESVPLVRGTNKRGGTAHDYLCRIDSDPVVSKALASAVYFEIMEYAYALAPGRKIWTVFGDWVKRWVKWGTVYVAPGYYHKYKVLATYEEIIA